MLLVVAGHLVLAAINIRSNLITATFLMVDGRFSGRFFQVDINIRPAEQGCVWDVGWVVEINLHPDTLEYIAVATWGSLIS